MSGGHFDYAYFGISTFAENLEHDIAENDKLDEFGYCCGYSPETIEMLKDCQRKIEKAGRLAHAVEWLYSDDNSEESFREEVDKING